MKVLHSSFSKFGNLSRRHSTGRDSFQSLKRAMPKNVQTTIQLFLFHILETFCPKSFKLGFRSSWTKNFQMYKLDLEKSEEHQYVSKCGKLSSGHRTGKSPFSFQSKECSNYRIIALISHASKVMLKFSKPGFSCMWTVNFRCSSWI